MAKKKKNRSERVAARGRAGPNPPVQAVRYTGPVRSVESVEQVTTVSLVHYDPVVLLPSGGTVSYNQTYTNGGVVSAADWTTVRATHQEYRVLGMTSHWVPKAEGGNGNSWGGVTINTLYPLLMAPFHGDATGFTGIEVAANHNDVRIGSLTKPLRVTVRMSEADEAAWTNTSATAPDLFGIKQWIQIAGVSADTNTYLGSTFTTWLVQFRGRSEGTTQRRGPRVVDPASIEEKKGAPPPSPSWADIQDEEDARLLTAAARARPSVARQPVAIALPRRPP